MAKFLRGVSAEFCYIKMWDVVQRTFIGENSPEEVWERTGDEPLFVCGRVEVSYFLSQKPLGHHSTNKDPLSGLDFDLDYGEYNFRTDLCDVAWHQFFRQLDPACKESLVHHSYHFDYQLLQNKVFLLLLNSEIKTVSDQTKECICGISALGEQVNFSVNVAEFYGSGYVRTLENSEGDDLTVHVEKKIPGEPFQEFDIELCVRLFDLSSFHGFLHL